MFVLLSVSNNNKHNSSRQVTVQLPRQASLRSHCTVAMLSQPMDPQACEVGILKKCMPLSLS